MAVKFGSGGRGFLGRAPKLTPAQLAAREVDGAGRDRARARRLRTRQHIVIGAALAELAERGDPDAARLRRHIVAGLTRKQDLELFKGDPDRP